MTVPYMKKPDSTDPESLALINEELRNRLYRASKILQRKNAEIQELRSGEATTPSSTEVHREEDAAPDDEEMLRTIYGYAGTQEYLELTNKIESLESELYTLSLTKSDLEHSLEKTLKGAEMKEAELREIIIGVRTETRKKDRKISQMKATLRRMSETHESDASSNQMAVNSMHIAGLEAQLSAFRKGHPESNLMQPSTDGLEPNKSRLRLIYEDAFDAKGVELGVVNPKSYRLGTVKSPT
ncbi:hypothetical protein [Sulfitobacter sp. R18_1]|uniref:hypothetical protein n=1 Tax=Sulfitobacter sp. R18_1 TaxID=2821104 RepID=UPI001ADB76EE|nr:hypothetical protein [Sulfitobacter sp. R18_1]MBO9428395.1 hypothetical protein [Sulfitobacter sp. R18_1]